MRLFRAVLALALACLALPAAAQDPRGKPIVAGASVLPAYAIYCDDGTNHAVLCNFGSGVNGTSAGDPSSTGTVGSTTVPSTVSMSGLFDGANVRRWLSDNAGRAWVNVYSLPAITGTVSIAGTAAVSAASLPLPTGAATAAGVAAVATALGSPVQAGSTLSNVIQVTSTIDRGAIVGTSAVQLMAINTARRGFSVQNQSSSASCYINGSGAATADYHSLIVGPGGYFEPDHHVGTSAISIICTAASTPVYSREW